MVFFGDFLILKTLPGLPGITVRATSLSFLCGAHLWVRGCSLSLANVRLRHPPLLPPAANLISNVLVLQAFPLSLSGKGIPIEIPEATFSVLHQLFLFQTSKRGWGWLALQLELDRP